MNNSLLHQLQRLSQPSNDELTQRALSWVALGASSVCMVWGFNTKTPEGLYVPALGVTLAASASLYLTSSSNRLATERRDMELVRQQGAKDGLYVAFTSELASSGIPADPPRGLTIEPDYHQDPLQLMLAGIKHLLVSAPTRSGKTSLVLSFVRHLYESGTDLIVLDPKNTNWLGIQGVKGQNIVHYGGADKAIKIVKLLADQVEKRTELDVIANTQNHDKVSHKPLWFIFDEYTDVISEIELMGSKVLKEFQSNLQKILVKGSGLNVRVLICAQSHLATDIKMSTQIRKSMDVIALGSPEGGYDNIDRLIQDQNVFNSEPERNRLDTIWNTSKESLKGRYCFATTLSNGAIGVTPDLSKIEEYRVVKPTLVDPPDETPDDPRYEQAIEALSQGMSRSKIILEVWKMKGTKYKTGTALWTQLGLP